MAASANIKEQKKKNELDKKKETPVLLSKLKEKITSINVVNNYRRIFPYIKPYLLRAILSIVVTIPIGTMDAAIAWVLKPYMDTVMIEKNEMSSFLPLLIILFSSVQSLLNYVSTYLNAWVGGGITKDLKKDLYKKMLRSDPAFFDKTTSGQIIFSFNTDADAACGGLLGNARTFTTQIFSSISLVGVLIYNSWQLSIIAIVVLFGALFPLTRVRRRIKDINKKAVASGANILTYYNEAFAGNRVVTSFNLYDYQANRFSEALDGIFKLSMNMTKKVGGMQPLMHFIVSIGIAGTIWLGGYLISNKMLTTGGFVSFITALLMLYRPIKSMGSNITHMQTSLMAMSRVFETLDKIPEIRSNQTARKMTEIQRNIQLKDVSFEYEEHKPVLKKINLTIKRGEKVAFVGNSGGGKTTIASLLARFYDVKTGSIKIDGTDIRNIDLDSLRSQIAFVFQDNILFSGTIKDNILLGNEEATDDELWSAVKNACLDEFISSLKDGLNTEIGERGTKLSGGQRQRVAIARAFIKNAPIIILDEATSALDNKSEKIVQQAIYNLMTGRTVIIIAHRLSTVRDADKIVVINNGEIAEIGSHNELINREKSIYASLYKTQLR